MPRKRKRKLKTGFTTGTAAAAAAKGALKYILEKSKPQQINVKLLTNDSISIPIHHIKMVGGNCAICTVIKDAGDDPDVTNRAEIGAKVTIKETSLDINKDINLVIKGGEGVGRVTKPGLEVLPGHAAINSGPQKMIRHEVQNVLIDHQKNVSVVIEVFVPEGKILAKKTLNARLGIIGGISILGTTGVVKPMSHEAYVATIQSALSVADAMGNKKIFLTTGRRSERYVQDCFPGKPKEAFIQMGDFFKITLGTASNYQFNRIILAAFFGKAIKMAQGIPHTHAAKASLSLKTLANWILDETLDKKLYEMIITANTARHAFEIIKKINLQLINIVGEKMTNSAKRFTKNHIKIQSLIFDYQGEIVFNSENIKGCYPS